MRVSIWQQFSSNHSSSFTVVGEFADHTSALAAADTLRKAGKQIDDWYSNHEEIREAVLQGHDAPTEAELRICTQYNIVCERALDWIANCGFYDENVAVYQNFVFVSNRLAALFCDNSAGESLFDQLMAALAVKTAVDEENTSTILVTVTCSASDTASAELIKTQLTSVLIEVDSFTVSMMPWIGYYSGVLTDDVAQIQRDYQAYLVRLQAERAWDEAHKSEKAAFYEANVYDDWLRNGPPQGFKDLMEQKERDLQHIPETDYTKISHALSASAATHAVIPWWANGSVVCEGAKLIVNNMTFSNIGRGLPALYGWLRDQACVDIAITFEQY